MSEDSLKDFPEIVIRYNRFLDPIFTFYCKNNPDLKKRGWNDWIPPTKEEVLKRVKDYKKEWGKYEKEIFHGLYQATKLNFKKNVIDVHIVSGNPRQFSRPIVIKSGFSSDEFVDTLTHELIHVLFSQNMDIAYKNIFKDMFPNEDKLVQNHVIVHAILKYIYIDVLKDGKRLERNLEVSKKADSKGYSRAWDIVEEEGYEKLIQDFREKIDKV